MNRFFLFSLLALFFLSSCKVKTTTKKADDQYLVILSLDGFRWDYDQFTATPNLDEIAAKGVKAERMLPSFPTTTFANHYSMATGLYPDHHGIVANSFYAPDLNAHYNDYKNRSSVEDGSFYGGEPIWVTAEKQHTTTATCFWVGSEADVQGIRPTYWKRYNHFMPYEDRIDTVLYWLQLPIEKRPKLIMWYFDEPDSQGHKVGPEGIEIPPLISRLDSLVGVFRAKVQALPHGNKVNFIIVSDHGMAQLDEQKQIMLDHYIDTSLMQFANGGNPTMNILAKEGQADALYQQITQIPNIRYWRTGEAPEHLHHGTHIRTHDITVLADDGYSIYWSWRVSKSKGAHGYDVINPDMHSIFYAIGPAFKTGYSKKSFQNIHLYPLMAHLLKLHPAETDGSLDSISDILKKPMKF